MTEEQDLWYGYLVPQWLLDMVKDRATPRKLRLLACAYARDQWELIPDERSRAAVEAAERYADGECTLDEMLAATEGAASVAAEAICWNQETDATRAARLAVASTIVDAYAAAYAGTLAPRHYPGCCGYGGTFTDACDQQKPILHDVFGNPFAKIDVEADWPVMLRPPVIALARKIYANHDFRLMPQLGDLLESSLFRDEGLIRHCREEGRHFRGCWAIDALLGMS